MKSKIFYIIGLSSIILFSSCGNQVEKDMTEWCECMQHAKTEPMQEAECAAIQDRIVDKYMYDPEASEIIRKKVEECETAMN